MVLCAESTRGEAHVLTKPRRASCATGRSNKAKQLRLPPDREAPCGFCHATDKLALQIAPKSAGTQGVPWSAKIRRPRCYDGASWALVISPAHVGRQAERPWVSPESSEKTAASNTAPARWKPYARARQGLTTKLDVAKTPRKYPQFRPLRETALGLKAGSNLLGAGVGLATGKFTGSVEKWMASTLKDLMKRDRFGPYADALPVRMAEDLIKKGAAANAADAKGQSGGARR